MFKIFVLLSFCLLISGLPSDTHGVEKQVDVVAESEQKPQAYPVPVEHVLKASLDNKKDEESVDATPLKSAEPTNVAADAPVSTVAESQNSASDETDSQKKTALLLIINKINKFTTTTTTTTTTTPTPAPTP